MSEAGHGERDALGRAEQIVERVTDEVGAFATRMVARAREEAEDIWAEAREVSHGTPRDGSQG